MDGMCAYNNSMTRVACAPYRPRAEIYLHSVVADEAHDAHGPSLAKAVHTRQRLLLHRHIERGLQQEHIAGCRCTAHSACGPVCPRGQLDTAVGPINRPDLQEVETECTGCVKLRYRHDLS